MAIDPDDITDGQLITPETMQKWTDSIRELQRLVPPARARASRATDQNVSPSTWVALGFSATDYQFGNVTVGPAGIGVTESGVYQVHGQLHFRTGTTEAATRRGIGITADSSYTPGTLTRVPYWWQDLRTGPPQNPWITVSGEFECDGGAVVTLWAFQDSNATLLVDYRAMTLRRVA